MLTPKELFYETLKKDGKPDRLLSQYEAFGVIMNDPLQKYTRGNRVKGTTTRDRWGTTILWPETQHAAMPHITHDDKVLPDITKWRDYVKVPELEANATDWSEALAAAGKIRDEGQQLVTCFMGTGVFEQCHYLMGFEDTLANLMLEPDDMLELINVIGDYRFTYAKLLVDNLKPDIILSHDDWGSKESLFMRPDIWREFFKPQYEKIYGYIKAHGVLIMHHADSFLEPIVEDMTELGIDVWQGALPTNNIVALQERLQGRMTLMGGIDSWIDRADSSEEEIRTEVRRVCETYGPGGHFIPSLTYGLSGSIFPQVEPAIDKEISAYNSR